MENKNYTITFGKAEELNENNYKEFANRTMHYGDSFFYKDSEIEIWGIGWAPSNQVVYYVNNVQHRVDLTSKRVSAKMGKEIESIILKAVAEYKEGEVKDMDIKIVYEDGFEYTDSVESTEPINPEDPWGHTEVDYALPQANMAYVGHMGWVEDFDSLEKADEQVVELWVNGELIWKGR